MMTEINVLEHMATLLGHGASYIKHKNAFLNDPKYQKRGFLGLSPLDRFYNANDDRNEYFRTFGNNNRQGSDWTLEGLKTEVEQVRQDVTVLNVS